MNLMQELRSLDPRDPGRWPFAVRGLAIAICFVVVAVALIYFFVWTDRMPLLQQREDQEQQLRSEYRSKHAKAVNLVLYKQQLADIEKSFGALLRIVTLHDIQITPTEKAPANRYCLSAATAATCVPARPQPARCRRSCW